MLRQSFVEGAEEGGPSLDPVRLIVVGLAYYRDDVVGGVAGCREDSRPFLCLVERALVVSEVNLLLCCLNRLEIYYWHLPIKHVGWGFPYCPAFEVNAAGLRE